MFVNPFRGAYLQLKKWVTQIFPQSTIDARFILTVLDVVRDRVKVCSVDTLTKEHSFDPEINRRKWAI
jgi:hypothetical protein